MERKLFNKNKNIKKNKKQLNGEISRIFVGFSRPSAGEFLIFLKNRSVRFDSRNDDLFDFLNFWLSSAG